LIDSVRHFADEIDDPKLQEDIRGFCGQEGFHRREHQRYNEALCKARGYDLAVMEGRLEANLKRANKFLSPIQRLAGTAAIEHVTAILAESALSNENPMLGKADDAMQALWNWHAAEEMEHKAVAFDVYRAVGGKEPMRRSVMRTSTFFLMLDMLMAVAHMLRKDGRLWNFKLWREGWSFLFSKGGVLRRVAGPYREYYQDGFHPWNRDTRTLLASWKKQDAYLSAA
jgi:predicted metal-dependent hydrolase